MIYVLAAITLAALSLSALTLLKCLAMVATDRANLTLLLKEERVAHAEQIAELCQRLQAPEQAVVDHSTQRMDPAPPQAVGMDDDAAQWAAIGVVPKDQLAEQAYASELA